MKFLKSPWTQGLRSERINVMTIGTTPPVANEGFKGDYTMHSGSSTMTIQPGVLPPST